MIRTDRRRTTGPVLVVIGCLLVLSGGPVAAGGIRTESGLGAYVLASSTAPIQILVDDPSVPIPRDEGSPIVEGDPSYTSANLATGPTGVALASSLWPGGLLGNGLPQLDPRLPPYPIQARGDYPSRNQTASLSTNGMGMTASAQGLDVTATASGSPTALPGVLEVGNVSSRSTGTVQESVGISAAAAQVADLTLLGLVKIGSVVTTVEARSNGRDGSSSGSTVVSQLSVNGIGYVVDDRGARPTGTPAGGNQPLPGLGADPAKALGITIEGVLQTQRTSGAQSERTAKGLRITVDTVLLRQTINQIPGPVTDALRTVFGLVPQIPGAPIQPQGLLYETLSAAPLITFIIGAGTSKAVANLPLRFDFLPLAALPNAPVRGGVPLLLMDAALPAPLDPPSAPGMLPVLAPGSADDPGSSPTVASPGIVPQALRRSTDDTFHGLGAGLFLLAALVAAGVGRGLLALQKRALSGAVAHGGCALGAPDNLPDLRGE